MLIQDSRVSTSSMMSNCGKGRASGDRFIPKRSIGNYNYEAYFEHDLGAGSSVPNNTSGSSDDASMSLNNN
jgi:hypothetical protein